jgi:DNA-binding NarL/FixJ family response regulator
MIEFKIFQKDILDAWNKSIHDALSPYIKEPQVQLSRDDLEKVLDYEEELISVFNECTYELSSLKCCSNYLFMLFDKKLNLISSANYTEDKKILVDKALVVGASFTSQSVGINAVSLATEKNLPVYLPAHQHFCVFLRDFYSSAIPLQMSGESIGYLKIMTTNKESIDELRYLLDLLSNAMMYKLHLFQCRKYKNMLSNLQLRILSLLANGKTEAEIAEDLNYSIQTIKYHKHEIYSKFNVKNTPDAITKLYKYNGSKCSFK